MDRIKNYGKLIDEWMDDEKKVTCGREASRQYKEASMQRFQYLFNLCKSLNLDESIDVLDVGRSYLTLLLSEYYSPLTTIGFDLGGDKEDEELGKRDIDHLAFDLNHAKKTELWPQDKRYDLVVCSEVIEHLKEAPEYAFLFLSYFLKPGGLLICSTPNAVAIHKRLKILLGKNPFEKIRFFAKNPGHFREYTKKELMEMGRKCGFQLVRHRYVNFLTPPQSSFYIKIAKRIYSGVTRFVPSWRNAQVAVFKKLVA